MTFVITFVMTTSLCDFLIFVSQEHHQEDAGHRLRFNSTGQKCTTHIPSRTFRDSPTDVEALWELG